MKEHMTLKNMPTEERPYEKCLRYGAEILSDSELLAVIIRCGTKEYTSVELARKILNMSKTDSGILSILHVSIHDLMKIDGIGSVKAIQIKCIAELSKRIAQTDSFRNTKMNSPASIAKYYMESLRHEEQEQIRLIMFDTKNRWLGDSLISKGTVNASLLSPREVFLEAFRYRSVYICLVHNHPSGDPTPSEEDISITCKIKEAGDLIGICLIDHIIIGDNKYISLAEKGYLI